MRNQKGEATIFCVLILVALSGLLTLCSLELQRSYELMQKRTNLFLCVKESKGELNEFLVFMGRTNLVIRYAKYAQAAAIFFPPLIAVAGNVEAIRKVLKGLQGGRLVLYLNSLKEMRSRNCPLDPRIYLTTFELGGEGGFKRNAVGEAILKDKKWTYYFYDKPYLLTLKVDASDLTTLYPKIGFQAEEKMGTLSSLLSSRL